MSIDTGVSVNIPSREDTPYAETQFPANTHTHTYTQPYYAYTHTHEERQTDNYETHTHIRTHAHNTTQNRSKGVTSGFKGSAA